MAWSRCCHAGGCGNCCVACTPCALPKADLTLTYRTSPSGTVHTVIIPYTGSGWTLELPAVGGYRRCVWTVGCSANELYLGYGCDPYVGSGFSGTTLGSTPTSVSCDPFSMHWYSLSAGILVFYDLTLSGPSGSAYGYPVCCQRFLISGCNSNALAGATVSVYDEEGGTLLTSGPTAANGYAALYWSGSCSVYVTVTADRFADHGASYTLSPSGTTTIGLTANTTDYVCVSDCAYPIAKTLYATHDVLGALTLTYNASGTYGAGWYVTTASYSYPGCSECGATSLPVTSYLLTNLTYIDVWKGWGGVAPPPTGCPGGTLTQSATFSGTVDCPLAFSLDYTMTPTAGSGPALLFCTTDPVHVVFTE